MVTLSLRAAARRTALAAAAATTAAVLAPSAASAMPAPAQSHLDDPAAVGQADRKQHRNPHRAVAPTLGEQVISLASQEAGDPYVYGAAGPDAFDCSGFTQYVFAQVGISLPHSSSAQSGVVRPVSEPQQGDMVFFTGSGGVYHVAIYAGDNTVWHSPRSGDVVSQEPIWTSSVFYGRVL